MHAKQIRLRCQELDRNEESNLNIKHQTIPGICKYDTVIIWILNARHIIWRHLIRMHIDMSTGRVDGGTIFAFMYTGSSCKHFWPNGLPSTKVIAPVSRLLIIHPRSLIAGTLQRKMGTRLSSASLPVAGLMQYCPVRMFCRYLHHSRPYL